MAHSKPVWLLQAGLALVVAGLLAPRLLSAGCINAALVQEMRSLGQPPGPGRMISGLGGLTGCFRESATRDHTWTFLPERVAANLQDALTWQQGLVSELQSRPSDFFAKKALGDAYLVANNLPLALQTYRGIADAQVLFALGQWARLAGNRQLSEGYLRLAVALAPQWAEAWFQLGEVQFAANNASAIDSYGQVLLWNPTPGLSARAHVRIGSLLAHRGDRAGAQAQFQAALDLDPRDWSAMEQMSRLYLGRGDAAQACEWAKRANAIAPKSVWVVRLLVDVRKVTTCEP